jgi:hypothetical protein
MAPEEVRQGYKWVRLCEEGTRRTGTWVYLVDYVPGEWVSAPYGPLAVFEHLQDAAKFADGRELWLAEYVPAEDPEEPLWMPDQEISHVRMRGHLRMENADFSSTEELFIGPDIIFGGKTRITFPSLPLHQSPPGTAFAAKVRLIKQLFPCLKGSWHLSISPEGS